MLLADRSVPVRVTRKEGSISINYLSPSLAGRKLEGDSIMGIYLPISPPPPNIYLFIT